MFPSRTLDRSAMHLLRLRAEERVRRMPPLPPDLDALLRILSRGAEGDGELAELMRVFKYDARLMDKVLRIANSALFARRTRVEDVDEASMILGQRRIYALLLADGLAGLLAPRLIQYGYEFKGLWREAVSVAATARAIAGALGFPPEQLESLFGAAILHDIGKAILGPCLDREGLTLPLEVMPSAPPGLVALESALLGTNHCLVGEALALHWKLDPLVATVVRHHHMPGLAPRFAAETAVVHVADHLVANLGVGATERMPNETPLDPAALEIIGRRPDFLSVCESQAIYEVATISAVLDALPG